MKTYSFFEPLTGVLSGKTYTGPLVEMNTPPGLEAIEGLHDHTKLRVDVASGLLLDWTPPPPDGAVLATRVRADRDRRLASCDWVTLRAMDSGQKIDAAWSAYRAALRNITQQPGFPANVQWPDAPA